MKLTIEIADDLLTRAKELAKIRHITLQSLIEESLAFTLNHPALMAAVTPITFKGHGLCRDFADASWDQIRIAIYP